MKALIFLSPCPVFVAIFLLQGGGEGGGGCGAQTIVTFEIVTLTYTRGGGVGHHITVKYLTPENNANNENICRLYLTLKISLYNFIRSSAFLLRVNFLDTHVWGVGGGGGGWRNWKRG